MKKIRVPLLTKVIIAIAADALLGQFLPGGIIRIFVTFNSSFGNFLPFSTPLIISELVTSAAGDLGKGTGKLSLTTVLIACGSIVSPSFFMFLSGSVIFPRIPLTNTESTAMENPEDLTLTPYSMVSMPPLVDVMTALLLSLTIGLGLSNITGITSRDSLTDFKEVIIKLIEVAIIPLLPLHVFGIFLNVTVSGQVMSIITMFLKVTVVIFALHILLLLIQFAITGAITGRNLLRLLKNMLPVYVTTLETQSSVAMIPVTPTQAVKNGARENMAISIVPPCATIHLAGSIMKIIACAMAIMIMVGEPAAFSSFSGFIMTLGTTVVAAPGVLEGVITTALGTLQSMLGFGETLQVLIIALYIAMDSFGTACNMTGNGAITVMVDKIAEKNTP